MALRYHTCGQPIDVEELRTGSYRVKFFALRPPGREQRIYACPRCGQHLAPDDLRRARPDSCTALHEWSLAWPELRSQIDQMVASRAGREEPGFTYHAELELAEFENALGNVLGLATRLFGRETALPLEAKGHG
jgi:hypothetical protein